MLSACRNEDKSLKYRGARAQIGQKESSATGGTLVYKLLLTSIARSKDPRNDVGDVRGTNVSGEVSWVSGVVDDIRIQLSCLASKSSCMLVMGPLTFGTSNGTTLWRKREIDSENIFIRMSRELMGRVAPLSENLRGEEISEIASSQKFRVTLVPLFLLSYCIESRENVACPVSRMLGGMWGKRRRQASEMSSHC